MAWVAQTPGMENPVHLHVKGFIYLAFEAFLAFEAS
jgi:hypothetical protein